MELNSIEAMKQALEALNTCDWDYDNDENAYKTFDEGSVNKAAQALRQAIEQAEKQEPIAWGYKDSHGDIVDCLSNKHKDYQVPLYTSPPRKEWVGLTDNELFESWVKTPAETDDRFAFARAIEAKLKEKNT